MDNCSQDTLFGSHSSRLHYYYHLISTAPIPANNEREVKKGLKSIETTQGLHCYSTTITIREMDASAPGQQDFSIL